MKFSRVALLLAALAVAPVTHAADIIGTITLKGTPPPEVALHAAHGQPGLCGDVQDHAHDAFLRRRAERRTGRCGGFVEGCHRQIHRRQPQPPVVLDQKGCLYVPQILAIQTGQKLVVKNSDNCIHNVHCTPTVAGNDEHNDAQMPGGADLTYTFPKPEMFLRFKCDVHPWMFAWVSVFDSPYFCHQRHGRQIRHQERAARQIHRGGRPPQARHTDAGRGGQGQRRDREFYV